MSVATTGVLKPVAPAERIVSIDVLRGVAVLGILVINIEFFALPMAVVFNPSLAGGFSGLNLLAWKFDYLLFLQKMMAIFSMLFGAGLVIMHDRAQQIERPMGGTYYRRVLWLLLFGLLHGYLLWYGDILFSYAICGLLLYPLRRRSPKTLIILGLISLAVGALISVASGLSMDMMKRQVDRIGAAQAAGETLTAEQMAVKRSMDEFLAMFTPTADDLARETAAYRGSYAEAFTYRVSQTVMMQTQGLLARVLWRVLGLMLLGMALMKLGVFSGQRSPRFYLLCVIIGYGLGLPLCGYGMGSLIAHNFDFIHEFKIGYHFNYFGSILVALGHVGLVILVCRAGVFAGLQRRLAAAGRMALSNYLIQTIVATFIFYGYGLGLFNRIDRFWLWGFVIGIWILQLLYSPVWLKHFRFGPAEWLWRVLTYRRRQPMRIESAPESR